MSDKKDSHWQYPGARWWKFDFHTHTPASLDTEAWQKAKETPDEVTPEKWLLKFMAAQVDCVAITDHNSGAWIDLLKSVYTQMRDDNVAGFRELYVFPGVEISVNGGCHLLAILDLNRAASDIDSLIGKVDYKGTKGDSDGVTEKSLIHVVQAILDAGGIPLPAHADGPKGLLQVKNDGSRSAVQDPNTIRQVLEHRDVLAMEVIDPTKPKPSICEEHRLTWSEVIGTDCHNFRADNVPGSRFTWVKMAEPSLEGLRLALMDGEGFSIRRSDDRAPFDPFALPEHFIEKVEISNARYMGRGASATLSFSPWFNALIGGRGTGKSTVVHFLRLAYQRENELTAIDEANEARRTFERFNRVPDGREDYGGLTNDTEVNVTVMRDGIRHRLRWRESGSPQVLEQTSERWLEAVGQIIDAERFPLRLFSQGQIVALTGESQDALLGLIDEAAGAGRELDALEEARRRYYAIQAQIRDFDAKLEAKEAVMVQLSDAQRKLARFEEAHHADILRAYQLRTRQAREIERQFESATEVVSRVQQLGNELLPEDVPEGLFDSNTEEDREVLTLVDRLATATKSVADALNSAAKNLREYVERERGVLSRSAWKAAVTDAESHYNELVAILKEQGVTDLSEYGTLVQERQRLETEKASLESLTGQRARLGEDADKQLQVILQARRAVSEKRSLFLSDTLSENRYVRMRTMAYGRDPRAIERSLREVLGVVDSRFEDDILTMENDRPVRGIVADLLLKLPKEGSTQEIERRIGGFKHRIETGCQGEGDFGGRFNNFLAREFERRPEFFDRLNTWFPEDMLQIEYSPKGDGRDFRPIEQASAGQRAAAMLAFLLAYGSEPIVLDQPEDDLDNHLIYDLVVQQIKTNKAKRQIITVTHNPNIVVNGDAEMLHALDFAGGQCRVAQSGSMQHETMRNEVCRVMEGGREAFERRYRRLGREVNRV